MKRLFFLLLVLILFSAGKAQNIVSAALKDRSGNLWFVVSDRGLYRYDGKIFMKFTEREGLPTNKISCIYEDKAGNLWVGTNDGVLRYDGKSFTEIPIPSPGSEAHFPARTYSRLPKDVSNILQDKAGNFWFVTLHQGVYRYDGKTFTSFLSGEVLMSIAEDKAGGILVGSWKHGGVYRYDGKAFTSLGGFSDNMIFCMLKDKAGNIWVGTRDHGVDRYDGKTITNFSEKEGLMNTNVSCIFEDAKGSLWFGSDARMSGRRGDVFRYDGRSFTNITARENLTMKDDLVYNVRSIVEDKAGNIWLGSRNGLLLRYDGRTFTDLSEKVSR